MREAALLRPATPCVGLSDPADPDAAADCCRPFPASPRPPRAARAAPVHGPVAVSGSACSLAGQLSYQGAPSLIFRDLSLFSLFENLGQFLLVINARVKGLTAGGRGQSGGIGSDQGQDIVQGAERLTLSASPASLLRPAGQPFINVAVPLAPSLFETACLRRGVHPILGVGAAVLENKAVGWRGRGSALVALPFFRGRSAGFAGLAEYTTDVIVGVTACLCCAAPPWG